MNDRKTVQISLILFSLLLSGCARYQTIGTDLHSDIQLNASLQKGQHTEEPMELVIEEDPAVSFLKDMTLEEKVAQLFIVCPESIMETAEIVTSVDDSFQKAYETFPVGGFIYMKPNLREQDQVKHLLKETRTLAFRETGLPAFLCIDEEGGSVARIGSSGRFDVPVIEDMSVIGQKGDLKEAEKAGEIIGSYLYDLGFNLDFAPVADVLTNPQNQVVRKRSFGDDPALVSQMAQAVRTGLESQQIFSVYKHFPGHGATAADTHEGYAYISKTYEEMVQAELIPFADAIANHISFIMVGHISLPNAAGDHTPASLSPIIIQDWLRKELGYNGLVITDALNMGAVTAEYSSAEAAVKTLEAGADLILMPADFREAYSGVIDAVKSGRISEERIDESVIRILKIKQEIRGK